MARLLSAFCLVYHASGHAWITSPMSRLELSANHWQPGMPDDDLRWCPSCCNHENSCGATGTFYTEPIAHWKPFYDQQGGIPYFAPAKSVEFHMTVTADHGGQSWLMLSCDDHMTEEVSWYIMERADREHHFMPSNSSGIYAWSKDESGGRIQASWQIPADFSCPDGRGVGRWLWKTANSCNDIHDVGKHTEPFNLEDFAPLWHESLMEPCGEAPETFISCFDFTTAVGPSPPAPPPRTSTPPPVYPCHALSPVVSDKWCSENCPANCPATLCQCDSGILV